jgi:hypothetical protein
MNANQRYARLVLQKHKDKEINAIAAYTALAELSDFPRRRGLESDEDYILRAAYVDFDDAPYGGAVFLRIADEILAS